MVKKGFQMNRFDVQNFGEIGQASDDLPGQAQSFMDLAGRHAGL